MPIVDIKGRRNPGYNSGFRKRHGLPKPAATRQFVKKKKKERKEEEEEEEESPTGFDKEFQDVLCLEF